MNADSRKAMNDLEIASQEVLFRELDRFPWDSETEFQTGLQAILGQDPQPLQKEHLTLRAQCFYYSRQAVNFYHSSSLH